MSHQLSQEDLLQMLAEAAQKVCIGAVYEHYKKQLYKVIGLAILEATDEVGVIYEAQYGNNLTFVRALNEWLEEVEWEGKRVTRFTKST
jgi:hypothetical protein